MKRWLVTPLAWIASAISLLIALAAGAIRLDQYSLQWKAERLQSDIRSLELRKSTYADARRLEDHWLDSTKENVCRPSWCDLGIFLNNTGSQHPEFFLKYPAAFAVYHALGGRVAGVYSFVRVRDNLLLEKGISLGIEATSTDPNGGRVDYELMGSIETNSLTWVSARHPEYQIGGPSGCMGCKAGWVRFTPFADPNDISRLTDINFACITRRRACTEQADVLPTAWRELQAEKSQTAPDHPDSCAPAVIRVLSREAGRVVLAKVIKLEPAADGDTASLRRVPNGVPQYADEWQERTIPVSMIGAPHIGDQLLVFDDATCPAAPATKENLDAALLGATEGWINPAHPPGPPFGTFKPPKIDVH